MKRHTKTLVGYEKDGVTYQHVFTEVLTRAQVEQRMVMDLHVNRSDILEIDYE